MTNTLLDLIECQAQVASATGAGIRQATETAIPSWNRDAREALEWVVSMRATFTADDLRDRLDQLGIDCGASPSATGGIFTGAQRDGLIVKTGRQIKSRRSQRYHDITEWMAAT